MAASKKQERLGEEKYNTQGCLMKIVEYGNANNIIVEFQDEYKHKTHATYQNFKVGGINNPYLRFGETNINTQGCLMKIIEYENNINVLIEFQDKYKIKMRVTYDAFKKGMVKNPYYPSVFGVGIIGNKYPVTNNRKSLKEYKTWQAMLERCFDEKIKLKHPTYKDVTCCNEWLLYENFYKWLHSQENFDKWLNGDRWCLDKDILIKGNKVYSPETCCLVPNNVNTLFVKNDSNRGSLPIGICKHGNGFQVFCMNQITNTRDTLGTYQSEEKGFDVYKEYKESLIKQIAQLEYNKGNITKACFEAMMRYEVEITD